MRSIKLFLVVILILISFLFLITAFLPSKVTVSKSTIVNATEQKIAMQINDFNNWKNWYPAFQNKEISVNIFRQNDTQLATVTNEKNQTISITLAKSVDKNIEILLSEQSKKNINYQFVFKPNGKGQTQLTWNVNTDLGWYPWKKLAGIFLDKVTGPQYEAALQNLKNASEK